MLFLLFSKVFTDILKIYELPKVYNKISKYCQTLQILGRTFFKYSAKSPFFASDVPILYNKS